MSSLTQHPPTLPCLVKNPYPQPGDETCFIFQTILYRAYCIWIVGQATHSWEVPSLHMLSK